MSPPTLGPTQRCSGRVNTAVEEGLGTEMCIIVLTVLLFVFLFSLTIKSRIKLNYTVKLSVILTTKSWLYIHDFYTYNVCFPFAYKQDFEHKNN